MTKMNYYQQQIESTRRGLRRNNSSIVTRQTSVRRDGPSQNQTHAVNHFGIWKGLPSFFAMPNMGNFFSWVLSCVYTSPSQYLKDAELQILQKFTNTSCQSQFIPISNNVEIRTLRFDLGFHKNTSTVVLLHGFMSGLGVWSPCFDLLAQHSTVYAIDLPGFGRSTRTQFLGDVSDIEYQFVSYLEEWRDAVGLESFIIAGHGFGGYLATLYAIKYPERVRHLVLVEPWGFTELPFGIAGKAAKCPTEDHSENYERNVPIYLRIANFVANLVSPITFLRCLPKIIINWAYQQCVKGTAPVIYALTKYNKSIGSYLYSCNALRPTGEYAFLRLNLMYFWAKSPIMYRIKQLDESVPISFIYGAKSSVDHKTGYEVYHQRPSSVVEVYMVQDAGHKVFMDSPERFCDILINIVENEKEPGTSIVPSTSGSEPGTEDLYWDCAWETINLSTMSLDYIEGGLHDNFVEEWDDFDFENVSNEAQCQDDSSQTSDRDIFYAFE